MNSGFPPMDYKIAVLGAGGVGKTSLLRAFFEKPFITEHKPTVDDYFVHGLKLGGVFYNVCIVDTSGSFSFPVMRRFAISHCQGFVVTYAINDAKSFQAAVSTLDEIIDMKSGIGLKYKRIPVLLVANKLDCNERQVSAVEAQAELDTRPWIVGLYTEVSSKNSVGVDGIFQSLINLMQAIREREKGMAEKSSLRRGGRNSSRKKQA
jgi:small GTP-binding protein